MLSVVWWTCAVFALATAHVYESCELARELLTLGIRRDQLSTWVCIAYHESSFNTAAQNYGSGDHGLLQISELYWCGNGKACGVSCASLRDEDISNDVKCALHIYKEHTKISGDGFTAWVVYPLCKQNTKKFLLGCEASLKNITVKVPEEQQRTPTEVIQRKKPPIYKSISEWFSKINNPLNNENEVNSDKVENVGNLVLPEQNKNIPRESDSNVTLVTNGVMSVKSNKSKGKKTSAYLTVSDILQKYFDNVARNNAGMTKETDWTNVMFDNIDELKLPVLGENKNTVTNLVQIKTRIKIKEKDDIPNISQNIKDYYGSNSEDKKLNNAEQIKNVVIDDIEKLTVPDALLEKITPHSPISTSKSPFKFSMMGENENKMKSLDSTPNFLKVAELFQSQPQSIEKSESKWKDRTPDNIDNLHLFTTKDTFAVSPLSLSFTTKKVYDYNSEVNGNLPPYLNLVRQVFGSDNQIGVTFKTDMTSTPVISESIQPVRNIADLKHRHSHRNSMQISTTPEVPITNKPPFPRRIESNQFRHKNIIKPSIASNLEIIFSTIKPSKSTLNQLNISSTANTMISTNPSTMNVYQYYLSIPTSSSLASKAEFTGLEMKQKTGISGYVAQDIPDRVDATPQKPWSSTIIPTAQKISTISTSRTKSTPSIFDLYLNSQKKTTSSTLKSWSWSSFRSTSQHSPTSTAASFQRPELVLTTIKPLLTSTSTPQTKDYLYQSTTKSTKPFVYTYSTPSPWSIKTIYDPGTAYNLLSSRNTTWPSQQVEITTPKPTTTATWFSRNNYTLKPWSWSFSRQPDAATLRSVRANDSSIGLQQTKIETITQKTNYKPWMFNNSTVKPWSWSSLGYTSTTQMTTTLRPKPIPERGFITSKPWSWTWLSSKGTEPTTQKTTQEQWLGRNYSTSNPSQLTTLPSSRNPEATTSRPRNWSRVLPVSLKTETVSTSKSWSWNSTSTISQKSNIVQTTTTSRPGIPLKVSNPWSWSWTTGPSKLPNNYTTQSTIKPWGSSFLSTYKPFSWITTTPTPKKYDSNNAFNHFSLSTTEPLSPQPTSASSKFWKTAPKNFTTSYTATHSIPTPRSTPAVSTTQSLFDLYLNNFGRGPSKDKESHTSTSVSWYNSREDHLNILN